VVSADVADTAFVEARKELPARGVQKPPCRVGEKQFQGEFSAAPDGMVKIPAGLRTRPAWWQLDRLGRQRPGSVCGGAPWAARHGVQSHARLEAAYGDCLLLQSNLEDEGAGSLAEDGIDAIVERVEKGDDTAVPDPTRRALRKSARSSLSSWQLALCLGKENTGVSKDFFLNFKLC
jgi:hypothetical protein